MTGSGIFCFRAIGLIQVLHLKHTLIVEEIYIIMNNVQVTLQNKAVIQRISQEKATFDVTVSIGLIDPVYTQ